MQLAPTAALERAEGEYGAGHLAAGVGWPAKRHQSQAVMAANKEVDESTSIPATDGHVIQVLVHR
jgi:hypothetical protein